MFQSNKGVKRKIWSKESLHQQWLQLLLWEMERYSANPSCSKQRSHWVNSQNSGTQTTWEKGGGWRERDWQAKTLLASFSIYGFSMKVLLNVRMIRIDLCHSWAWFLHHGHQKWTECLWGLRCQDSEMHTKVSLD